MGKLIDGDKLISTLVWGHYGIGNHLQTVQQAIDDMRGEDAVHNIIRCHECKYFRVDFPDPHEPPWCRQWGIEPDAGDYCSRAERHKHE